jgi:hypothetical protein
VVLSVILVVGFLLEKNPALGVLALTIWSSIICRGDPPLAARTNKRLFVKVRKTSSPPGVVEVRVKTDNEITMVAESTTKAETNRPTNKRSQWLQKERQNSRKQSQLTQGGGNKTLELDFALHALNRSSTSNFGLGKVLNSWGFGSLRHGEGVNLKKCVLVASREVVAKDPCV